MIKIIVYNKNFLVIFNIEILKIQRSKINDILSRGNLKMIFINSWYSEIENF